MSKNALLTLVSASVVIGVMYFLAIVGDFLLARAMDARAEAAKGEGSRLMDQRYQTQDLDLIAQAETEGYQNRILLPLFVEGSSALTAFADDVGFAPLGLEPNKKLYICNEGHGALRIVSDRFGYRNPDNVWDDPDVDLALVGDSFAFGVCLQDADTIVGNLEDDSILNMSFPGALPVHYAAIIETFGPEITADKFVLIFYANDHEPVEVSPRYRSWFLDTDADPSDFFLTSRPLSPSPALQEFSRLAREEVAEAKAARRPAPSGAIQRNVARVKKVLSHATFPAVAEQIAAFRSAGFDRDEGSRMAIEALSTHCAQADCRPLVVYIPNSPFWDPYSSTEAYAAILQDLAQSYGVPFLDVTPALSELGRSGYADLGIHLSKAGYTLVADAIHAHYAKN